MKNLLKVEGIIIIHVFVVYINYYLGKNIIDLLPDHCPSCPEIPEGTVDEDLEYMVRGPFKWMFNQGEKITNSFHVCSEDDIWKNLYLNQNISDFINNVQEKQIEKIKITLKENPSLEIPQTDFISRNLLFDCVLNDDINTFDYLLNSGFKLSITNVEGLNLIQFCTLYNKIDMLKYILEINDNRIKETLSLPEYKEKPEIGLNLQHLLNKKWIYDDIEKPDIIPIDKMDKKGRTAFHIAVLNANIDVCEILIKHKCNYKVGYPWV